MKILYILDSLNRGGAEMLALDVCRKAKKNGLDLSFVATGGGTLEEDFLKCGVEFFRLQRRLPIDVKIVYQLRKIIKHNKFDVIHAHQAVEGIHAYLATMFTKTKVVLSFPGVILDTKNRLALKFLVPRTAANIACSQGLLEWIAKVDQIDTAEFKMIYNGVDRQRLSYSGESLKKELGISADTFLFGMVAHFYPQQRKDQITLCRAFAKISKELPNAHLIIVGKVDKGAEAKYEECVRICEENNLLDRVHFLGQRNDLAKVVSAIDAYVFSSFYEGLPIALMEAMLSKKVCILSDIPPHLEISQNGTFAETFQTQNADDLAEKMLKVANNESFRADLANRAFSFANETFSIEAHLKNLKNLYQSIG